MAISFKPEGYSAVSPYLIAAGAQQVIDFLRRHSGLVNCGAMIWLTVRSCTLKC
jgi:hypothetical protein